LTTTIHRGIVTTITRCNYTRRFPFTKLAQFLAIRKAKTIENHKPSAFSLG